MFESIGASPVCTGYLIGNFQRNHLEKFFKIGNWQENKNIDFVKFRSFMFLLGVFYDFVTSFCGLERSYKIKFKSSWFFRLLGFFSQSYTRISRIPVDRSCWKFSQWAAKIIATIVASGSERQFLFCFISNFFLKKKFILAMTADVSSIDSLELSSEAS